MNSAASELAQGADDAGAKPAARAPARFRPQPILVALIVVATLAYYFWTATIVTDGPPPIRREEPDYFNLLSRGFRKGHLYLDSEVPAALVQAPNPYDPIMRQAAPLLHDASYYRGRYYIYFGPAPVITLLLPFSLITGHDLPLSYAVWVFSALGYLALVATVLFLVRRYYPHASLLALMAALIAVGGADMAIPVLRRAALWELSAAAGFAFFAVSLFCLIRALHARRAAAWSALGGLCLGLAVASRPTYILCSVLFAVPVLVRWLTAMRPGTRASRGPETSSAYDARALAAAAATCGVIVLGLFAYNYARFQNPFEFGQKYQLSGIIEGDARHFALDYIPFNFRVYLLAALRWLPEFPFQHGIDVPPFPAGYGGHEYTFGLLPNVPFSLFSAVAVGALGWRRLRREQSDGLGRTLGVIALAAAINLALLLVYFGACIRYTIDFVPYVMVLACLGLFEWETRISARPLRALLGTAALALAVFSAFTVGTSVAVFYDDEPGQPPRVYQPIARVLNWPMYRHWQQRWPEFGPVEISLSLPENHAGRRETVAAIGRDGDETAALLVEYLGDDKIRFVYRENREFFIPIYSTAMAVKDRSQHVLRLSVGGTYAEYRDGKGRLRAEFDHTVLWDEPSVSFGVYPGKWHFGRPAAVTPAALAFTGEIHAVRSIGPPEFHRRSVAGVRTRLTPTAAMVGRAFPLVATGRPRAGDLFSFRVLPEDKIAFGFDHWGVPLITSPEIPWRLGETRVVEFWLPSLSPTPGNSNLVVRVDGITVWEQAVTAFAVTPETVFIGSNPIGATTSERGLANAIVDDIRLPPPGPQVNLARANDPRGGAAIRLRVKYEPGMTGRSFPIVTTGRAEAGDLFFIRMLAEDKISFGYDHWAAPLMLSPQIPWRVGESRLIECWVPALAPPGTTPALIVKLDGQTVWARSAPAFPATPATIYVGTNPIGGSTCEHTLENASLESTAVAPAPN